MQCVMCDLRLLYLDKKCEHNQCAKQWRGMKPCFIDHSECSLATNVVHDAVVLFASDKIFF